MNPSILIALLIVVVASVAAVRQEFTFFDRFRHEAEDSLTLTRHYPNVTGSLDFFLKSARGRCVQGQWATYLAENYEDIYFQISSCSDHSEGYFANVKSLRHLGASDTTARAISFYEKELYQGTEFFAQVPASATGPNFSVHSIVTTGNSNWMVFEEPNFTGHSVCVEPTNEVTLISRTHQSLNLTRVGSFIRSCDAKLIANYVHALGDIESLAQL